MGYLFEKNNLLRITGLSAIFGMLVILFVDIQLLYLPSKVNQYSIFKKAIQMSHGEIHFYSRLGLVAVPFVLFGLFHFFISIYRTNKILAWATLSVLFYGYLNSALYFTMLGYLMNAAHEVVNLHIKIPYVTEHVFNLFQVQYFGGIVAGSVLYFISLRFFKNNFPSWYFWISPLYLIVIIRFLLPLTTPSYISSFLFVGAFNLCMLITSVISLCFLWKKGPDELFVKE